MVVEEVVVVVVGPVVPMKKKKTRPTAACEDWWANGPSFCAAAAAAAMTGPLRAACRRAWRFPQLVWHPDLVPRTFLLMPHSKCFPTSCVTGSRVVLPQQPNQLPLFQVWLFTSLISISKRWWCVRNGGFKAVTI